MLAALAEAPGALETPPTPNMKRFLSPEEMARLEDITASLGANGLARTTIIGRPVIFEELTANRARATFAPLDAPRLNSGLWRRSPRQSRPPALRADGSDLSEVVLDDASYRDVLYRVINVIQASPRIAGDDGTATESKKNTDGPALPLPKRTSGASHATELAARLTEPAYLKFLEEGGAPPQPEGWMG